jgi:hypothetical protein
VSRTTAGGELRRMPTTTGRIKAGTPDDLHALAQPEQLGTRTLAQLSDDQGSLVRAEGTVILLTTL